MEELFNSHTFFSPDGDDGGNPTPEEIAAKEAADAEAKAAADAEAKRIADQAKKDGKFFTQAQIDDMVVKRLAKERLRIYKKFGVEDEAGMDAIIERAGKYESTAADLKILQAEKESRVLKDKLLSMKVDPAFVDYALTAIEAGEKFEENAKAFIEANPKMLVENYSAIDSSIDVSGGKTVPDLAKMSTAEYLKWREKNPL